MVLIRDNLTLRYIHTHTDIGLSLDSILTKSVALDIRRTLTDIIRDVVRVEISKISINSYTY